MKTPWPYPKLFAHRGGGKLAPENTLAAMRLGISLGYRAVEFDVKLSRDGIAILLHDATLERTTSGKGAAGDTTWAILAALDAGAWHSLAFRGEPVARFDETASLLIEAGVAANVEIKPTPGAEAETGKRVAELSALYWRDAKVPPLLSSFSFEALEAAHGAAPHLPRAWLINTPGEEEFARLPALGAVSLHCHHEKISRDQVARFHDAGYRVLTYTVNDEARAAQLMEWGIDGIFTDNLAEFARRFPQALAS
jgi:glycerophosphoryl diester phosphodiesterase